MIWRRGIKLRKREEKNEKLGGRFIHPSTPSVPTKEMTDHGEGRAADEGQRHGGVGRKVKKGLAARLVVVDA
jgi:hypothetical protein